MKVPHALGDILKFAMDEVAPQCLASQKRRLDQYATWKAFAMAGTEDATRPSIFNRCGPHMERLGAFLFSPTDVRFLVEFGRGVLPEWVERAETISDLLTEDFHGTSADLMFSFGVPWALCYGSTFVRPIWKEERIETFLVMPGAMGVYREDVNGLDRQQAVTYVCYVTRSELAEFIKDHPRKADIMERAGSSNIDRTPDEEQGVLHQVVIGGAAVPGGLQPTGGLAKGQVDIFNTAPEPILAPEVLANLVKITEVWLKDDERDDWTTVQFCEPGILLEPYGTKRNTYLRGRLPFTLVQPNFVPNYFWGRSEFADLWRLQDIMTTRLDDIEHITRLRAHPPRAFIGFSGISDESKEAIGALDGLLVEPTPNAKIENLAPEMPSDAYQNLAEVRGLFDETAGFSQQMQGINDPGVRSMGQAQILSRAGSARMRDRALLTERQAAEFADLYLELLIAKREGAEARGEVGKEWLLAQMPDQRTVKVDSHSASPAFAMDNDAKAFGLARAGAIDEEGLLLLTHPPLLRKLLSLLKARKAAQAQWAKEHPEEAAKAMTGKKGKR